MADIDPIELSRTLPKRVVAQNRWGGEREYTDAVLQQLRDDRLIGVVVPPSHGGLGLSVGDAARITYNIARMSTGAGLIYAMHMSQAFTVIRHASETPFFDDFLRRMVDQQMLIGSATSEAGVGGDIFGSICTVEDEGDGQLKVVKDCPIISYFNHCGAVLVTAMRKKSDDSAVQVLIVGEVGKMEWVDGKEMALTGMRGMVNKAYMLTTRFDASAIFTDDFPEIQRATMTPVINIMWAAVWSGIAWQALDKSKRYLAKSGGKDAEIDAIMRYQISRLSDKHYTMNAIIRDAIAEEEARSAESNMIARMVQTAHNARMKVICSELLQDICKEAMGLIGMGSYALDGPYSLSELARDAMSAQLMVSNYRLSARNAKIERFIEENL